MSDQKKIWHSGIILIRTDAHNLLCDLCGLKYDRIGFVNEGMMWLYWTLPTGTANYIGPEDDYPLVGANMLYSKYTGNKDLFRTALKALDKSISISFEDQCFDGDNWAPRPVGIRYFNQVLEKLGYDADELMADKISLFYNKFDPPRVHKRNRDHTEVICKDLADMINHNPNIILIDREKRLKRLAKEAGHALFSIVDYLGSSCEKRLCEDDISGYISIATQIDECMMISRTDFPYTPPVSDMLLVAEVDGSIKKKCTALSKVVKDIASEKRVLNLEKLIKSTNDLLLNFGFSPIKPSWTAIPYSCLVGVADEKKEIKKVIDSPDGAIVIPLSGEGLDRLTTEQLKYVLARLTVLRDEDEEFDVIRKEATRLYYLATASAEDIDQYTTTSDNSDIK